MILPYKVYKIARFEAFIDAEYRPKRVTFEFNAGTKILKSKEIFDNIVKPYIVNGKSMIKNFEIETNINEPYLSLKEMLDFIGTYWNRYSEKELKINNTTLDKEHNNVMLEISKLMKKIHALGYHQGKDDVFEKLDVKARTYKEETEEKTAKAIRAFVESVKHINYEFNF